LTERGTFVVEGNEPGVEFLVQSDIPDARGMFLLHNVPGPYTAFSDFAAHITDASLRNLAAAQTCWLSVDLMHRQTPEEEAYRFIGGALAQLAPPDAAALVHPSRLITLAVNDEVRRQLASGGNVFDTRNELS
jgi:hypothetical protein